MPFQHPQLSVLDVAVYQFVPKLTKVSFGNSYLIKTLRPLQVR